MLTRKMSFVREVFFGISLPTDEEKRTSMVLRRAKLGDWKPKDVEDWLKYSCNHLYPLISRLRMHYYAELLCSERVRGSTLACIAASGLTFLF